jgi:hypothetical protein
MNTPNRSPWNRRNEDDDIHVGEHQPRNTAYYVERWINNRGKGPRNYRRSDSRIEEDINERLLNDPYLDATDIVVTVSNGEVTLTGMTPDDWSRRQAENHAYDVGGVLTVQNALQTPSSSEGGVRNEDSKEVGNKDTQLESFRENLKGHHSP